MKTSKKLSLVLLATFFAVIFAAAGTARGEEGGQEPFIQLEPEFRIPHPGFCGALATVAQEVALVKMTKGRKELYVNDMVSHLDERVPAAFVAWVVQQIDDAWDSNIPREEIGEAFGQRCMATFQQQQQERGA